MKYLYLTLFLLAAFIAKSQIALDCTERYVYFNDSISGADEIDTLNLCKCGTFKVVSICNSAYVLEVGVFRTNGNDTTFFYNNKNPKICFNDTGQYGIRIKQYTLQDSIRVGDVIFGNKFLVTNCPPQTSFFPDRDTLCAQYHNSLKYTNTSKGINTYQWFFEGGSPSTYMTTNLGCPPIAYDTPGIYKTTLIATNELGSDTAYYTIYATSPLDADTSLQLYTVQYGESITLVACGVGQLYIWNPESNIYSNTVQVKPDKEISNYSCKIVGYGCEATCKYQVNVEGITGTIYIPNAFTPNGNGNNDVFQVFGKNIKLVRLQIFNRWGEKVFDTPDIALGWDGTYKGTPQPAGIYAYQLTYFSGIETTARETKGSITLIR